jgi:hypothetical protein
VYIAKLIMARRLTAFVAQPVLAWQAQTAKPKPRSYSIAQSAPAPTAYAKLAPGPDPDPDGPQPPLDPRSNRRGRRWPLTRTATFATRTSTSRA